MIDVRTGQVEHQVPDAAILRLRAYARSLTHTKAETATEMHVHPNTIGQRLDRVGRLLGATWRNPERRVEVQIALRLHALREGGIEPTQ